MTEQRYGYTYHRVLVDSTRVLDSQFDDAVIYVTGAQLELLRNMTQYLSRLSSYVSEYHPNYYLSPTVEDYDDIQAIVADLESVLMGNPNTIWGYYDRWFQSIPVESVGDAQTYVSSESVPEGYVYVLEHWTIVHLGGQTCSMTLYIDTAVSDPILYYAPAVPDGEFVYQTTNLTLKEGDYITLRITGLPNTTLAFLRVWGHTMKVPA